MKQEQFAEDSFVPTGQLTRRCLSYFMMSQACNLAVNAVIILAIVGFIDLQDLGGEITSVSIDWPHLLVFGIFLVSWLMAYSLSCYNFLLWNYQIVANLRAFDLQNSGSISPRWAVIWWFVPVANLFKAHRSIGNAWRASQPSAQTTETGQRWLALGNFWTIWIIGNVLSVTSAGAFNPIGALLDVIPGTSTVDIMVVVLIQGLLIWSFFLVRHIMRTVDRLQSQRRATDVFG